jgi:hypothetical protein
VSLLDLSPYIYDALHPQLLLLGGHTGEDGSHDWVYLLGHVGLLNNAQRLGAWVHGLGGVLTVATLAWAAVVLWRQWALTLKGRVGKSAALPTRAQDKNQ